MASTVESVDLMDEARGFINMGLFTQKLLQI
jgi:hypothetical protein